MAAIINNEFKLLYTLLKKIGNLLLMIFELLSIGYYNILRFLNTVCIFVALNKIIFHVHI